MTSPVCRFKNASVCTFKTSPCMPATRAHAFEHVRVASIHGDVFECTHGGVLNLHTGVFSVPHHTTPHHTTPHHTTPHHTTPHTTTPPHTNTPPHTPHTRFKPGVAFFVFLLWPACLHLQWAPTKHCSGAFCASCRWFSSSC